MLHSSVTLTEIFLVGKEIELLVKQGTESMEVHENESYENTL